ncbi:MAG: ester cyclase [Actinomycetota bacterium]
MAIPDIGGTWSSRDGQRVASMYTEDGVRHQIALPEARLQGRAAIAEAAQGLIDAVPDEVVEIRKVTEGSNGTVVVEWVFRGTHTNDLPGLPARNEAVNLIGVSVCDMQGDLIKEERVYWDTATLLAGAGVLG